ncbi:MAG TPA: hypothetical protein VIA06_23940 [Candidatus Dormibacteraeota bacterium]|jgi:hypothetical protein|nr:hypothetical protein [Candidatus Dormibacteraeota bacterium]
MGSDSGGPNPEFQRLASELQSGIEDWDPGPGDFERVLAARRRRAAIRHRRYLAGGIVLTVLMLGLFSFNGGPRSIAYRALQSVVGLQTPLPVLGSGGGGRTATGPTPTAGPGGQSPRATVPIARRSNQPGDPGQQTPEPTPTAAGHPTSGPSTPGGAPVIAGPRSTPTPEATPPPVESTPEPTPATPEPTPSPTPGLCLLNLICIY